MSVRIIKKSWWVDFRFRRIRYRKRSPANTKAGAQEYESFLRLKLIRGESIEDNNEKSQSFKKFAWEWFDVYVKNNNKYSEIRGKQMILEKHLIPFFGKTSIDKINYFQVEKYKSLKMQEGLTNKTVNNHITVLRTSLRTAEEWFDLERIPKIKMLKVNPYETKFLTYDECQLLLNQAKGIWHEMILLALKTGIRFGELRALEWSDINWETKILTIKRSIFRCVINSPKSNKERHIPLTSEVQQFLLARRNKRGYIFATDKGEIIEENKVRRELWRACDRAKMNRVGWHCLRHTFASHLAMKGASLKAVQELLGHADIQTTMRYAHLTPSTLKDTVELLENKPEIQNFGQPMVNRGENLAKIPIFVNSDSSLFWLKQNKKQGHEPLSFDGGDGGN